MAHAKWSVACATKCKIPHMIRVISSETNCGKRCLRQGRSFKTKSCLPHPRLHPIRSYVPKVYEINFHRSNPSVNFPICFAHEHVFFWTGFWAASSPRLSPPYSPFFSPCLPPIKHYPTQSFTIFNYELLMHQLIAEGLRFNASIN